MLEPGVNFRRFASKSDNRACKSETNVERQSRADQLKRDILPPDLNWANYLKFKVRSELKELVLVTEIAP